MNKGVLTPFYKVIYKKLDLSSYVTSFRYTHAEDEDDVCTIDIELPDEKLLDSGAFRANCQWVVTWGFIEDKLNGHTEKIFIEEVVPTFQDSGISLNIIAHDKIAKLKKIRPSGIVRDTNLPNYLAAKGKDLGITVKVEAPGFKSAERAILEASLQPGFTPAQKAKWEARERNLKSEIQADVRKLMTKEVDWSKELKRKEFEERKKNAYITVTGGIYRDPHEARPSKKELRTIKEANRLMVENGMDPREVEKRNYIMDRFSSFKSIPEANRTISQIANQMALRDPKGPYTISGHGDTAIIRQRILNKPPIYSYTYRGGSGELISFKPSTKNKSSQSVATGVGYSSFNYSDKSFTSGNILDGKNPMTPYYLGNTVNKPADMWAVVKLEKANGQSGPFAKGFYNQSVAVRDGVAAPITSRIVEKPKPVQDPNSPSVNPTREIISSSEDPTVAEAQAANTQSRGAMEQNPGSVVVMGNTAILSGETVQIKNVGKSYSGNYYILKATHTIDSNGYITEMEVARNAVGMVDSLLDTEAIVNPKMGKVNNKPAAGDISKTKYPQVKNG